MSLDVSIANASQQIAALSAQETSDGRTTASVGIYDAAGTSDFQPRQPVTITDTTNGYTFTGYVNDNQVTPHPNGTSLDHTIACVDGTDIPMKRFYAGPEWTNRYAGDILTDLTANVLSAEGISANYAIDEDRTVSDFQQGTLSNTAAVSTLSGGALQLAPAGSIVTKTESSAAQWNAGTLTGAMTNGDLLQLNAHPALSFSGVCSSGYGNAYAYYRIWSGTHTIQAGDKLRYKVWINSGSPQIMAGVDAICTDGTSLRDFNSSGGGAGGPAGGFTFDQNGLRCHPGTDLSGFANDQWYSRTITFLSGMNGKVISYVDVAFEGDSAGTYQAYFYDIWIENSGGTITQNLYGNQGVISPLLTFPNLSAKVSNIGYNTVQLNAITAYEATGTRTSANNSIQNASIYQSSLLSWLATTPTGTALVVSTSVDGGATYQPATNQAAISNIPLGARLTSRNITTRIVMSISGKDPTATPQVSNITWTVNPAYAATQIDTRSRFRTQADWNTGTLSETLATAGGDLTINSVQHQWNDGSTANQTLFGGGTSALQSTYKFAASLRASTAFVAQSRLDFASNTWQNFIMSIDVQVPAANTFVGIEYRQTFFDNNPNTGAYLVDLSTTTFNFGRGTNSATNTHTSIQTTSFSPALTVGDWHTITIVVSGNTHTHYLDGVQYWTPQTDSTFTAAGYFALRLFNSSGGDQTCYYDNFGVMPIDGVYPGPGTFSGPTWTSPSIALGSFTAGNNLLFWDASTIAGDYLNVQANFNGGGYQNCTNNAPIPGIVQGTAYVSATLQLKVQMQAATAADTPALHGLTSWVTSQYSSSGSRISPTLSLAPVGTIGSTSATWLGAQPANTGIFIDTSTDGSNWTNIGTGASGSGQIAGLFTPTDPVVDEFSSDTSNNYISTCRTGGTIAAWTWNTALRRIQASGGTNAHLLYASPVIGADVDVSCVLDQSDNGGFVWRWIDQGDHYALAIHDASSPNNPNVMELFSVIGGGGGTVTPLTTYETSITSATLSSAKQLSETLGTGAFTSKQSTIGTGLNFGELFSFGTTNAWAASSTLLDPTVNNAGWIDDGITLERQTLGTGVYTATVRLGLNVTASITADIWVRYYKRSSGGTYTSIGDCVLTGQTITATLANYTPSGSLLAMSFSTGDKLYRMVCLNVTSNTNGIGTLACKIGMSNAANTGITTAKDVTPGYQTGSGGATNLLNSVPISFVRGTPHAFRVRMIGPNIDVDMDGLDMIDTGDTSITSAGFAGFRNDSSGGASSANFYLFRLQYYGQNVTSSIVLSRVRFTSTDPTQTPILNQLALSVHDPNIQNGALIPQTNYSVLNGNKMTVLDIFNDLTKQSENFWMKMVNFSPVFQHHQATPAPWCLTPTGLTGSDMLDKPVPTVDTINDTYRNSQWGTGGTDVISQTREFVGNGTQTTFDAGFNIDSITSITLTGNITQTFGLNGSSSGVQWYYTQGQSSIVQDASGIPISGTSQTLTVAFNAQVGITVNVQSPTEIARIQQIESEGGNNPTTGIIDYGEDMSGLDKQAMIARCAALLGQWAQENGTITFSTQRNGLAVGQLLPVFASPLGVFAGAYLLTQIKLDWNVESVGGGAVAPYIEYACQGVSGAQVQSWARFNSLGKGA